MRTIPLRAPSGDDPNPRHSSGLGWGTLEFGHKHARSCLKGLGHPHRLRVVVVDLWTRKRGPKWSFFTKNSMPSASKRERITTNWASDSGTHILIISNPVC